MLKIQIMRIAHNFMPYSHNFRNLLGLKDLQVSSFVKICKDFLAKDMPNGVSMYDFRGRIF